MDKLNRINLTINQKLEIIQKLESGISASHICEQYGIKKQTVSDIKKNKGKINNFALMCDVGENSNTRKRMKLAHETSLEEAIIKWYVHQRSSGVPVRAIELKSVAIKLANDMEIPFRASDGWLWRFRKRHGIMNKRIYSKASNGAKEDDEGDPGYNIKTEGEIEDEALNLKNVDRSEDGKEEEMTLPIMKLSAVRSHLDDLITFINYSSDNEVKLYYTHFRNFRELIIKKQQTS